MNFHPLFNAVVIEPLEECEACGSLIAMPDSSRHTGEFGETGGTVGQYNDRGRVVAVGAGYKYGRRFHADYTAAKTGTWEEFVHESPLPLEVKVGDIVIYAHKGGEDHTIENGRYRIISERQIDAVLEA